MSTTTDSSSGEAELREQVKVLGEKFLLRTAEQINTLRAQVARLRGGDRDALAGMQELAHKIHGSGAMFGFAALSDRAGEIERLVAAGGTGTGDTEPAAVRATAAERRESREAPAARRGATPDRLGALIEELAAALEATRREN